MHTLPAPKPNITIVVAARRLNAAVARPGVRNDPTCQRASKEEWEEEEDEVEEVGSVHAPRPSGICGGGKPGTKLRCRRKGGKFLNVQNLEGAFSVM